MSNSKFAAGVLLAGALAFGANFAAMAITAPMLHGAPAGSSSGQDEPTDLAPEEVQDLESLLIGRWQAPEPANQDAFVEFTEYGLWTGSDGCNGAQGNWSVESDGTFDSGTGGAMTQVGCDNVAIPTAVWDATQVEITADDELILTNETGEELLLVRASTDAFSLVGSWVHEIDPTDDVSMVEFSDDGTWVGGIGCAEFSGTWKLGVHDVHVLEETGDAPTPEPIFSGPGTLVISGEAAPANKSCAGAPDDFVLGDGSEYLFFPESSDAFKLGAMINGEMQDPAELAFTRG